MRILFQSGNDVAPGRKTEAPGEYVCGDQDENLAQALRFLELDANKDLDTKFLKEYEGMRIPRILHQVHIGGEERFEE
jgi:hypothetical protein